MSETEQKALPCMDKPQRTLLQVGGYTASDIHRTFIGEVPVLDITAMTTCADRSVAFVIARMHCTEPESEGQREDLEFRLTIFLQQVDGQWTIMHEHHSVPASD